MSRYKIEIEYDGTSFVGWQFQKNGLSIQEVLQNAIFNFSKEKVTVIGAGRTDSGVHALAQIAHFDLKKKIETKKFLPALNQYLRDKKLIDKYTTDLNKSLYEILEAGKSKIQIIKHYKTINEVIEKLIRTKDDKVAKGKMQRKSRNNLYSFLKSFFHTSMTLLKIGNLIDSYLFYRITIFYYLFCHLYCFN